MNAAHKKDNSAYASGQSPTQPRKDGQDPALLQSGLAGGTKSNLNFAAATTIGKVRTNNEDSYLLAPPLFALADGMGGHEAGEVASQLTIETLKAATEDLSEPENLRHLVQAANVRVLEAPKLGIGRVGMGTTLTAAVIDNDRLLLAQVGDSRAYLLHDGHLRRLTRDHSLMEEMLSSGEITEEEARVHPARSVITGSSATKPNTQPDLYELQLTTSDRLLLCSDGLHDMLTDAEIEAILIAADNIQTCANALVRAANDAGGVDNCTVVLVDIQAFQPVRAKRTHRGLRKGIIAFIIAFVLLSGGTVAAVWFYAQNSAYLIAENNHVVVYRGLLGDVFGIQLHWREEDTGIPVDQLDPPLPERLERGIQVGRPDQADELINEYRRQIAED